MRRRKVHFSADIEGDTEAAKRRTPKPVILEIDARQAVEEGIKIEKASEKVFIVDYIPRKFIKRIE